MELILAVGAGIRGQWGQLIPTILGPWGGAPATARPNREVVAFNIFVSLLSVKRFKGEK